LFFTLNVLEFPEEYSACKLTKKNVYNKIFGRKYRPIAHFAGQNVSQSTINAYVS
jgi:hypothetical protein